MSQYIVLLSVLCLVLTYSCARGFDSEERIDKYDEFPWLVSVGMWCGPSLGAGSLISNRVVLTAWKVIEDRNVSQLAVRIDDSSRKSSIKLRIRSVVRHPNFNQTTGAYNLALLFLKKTIEFTYKIGPINLATQLSMRDLDFTSCIVQNSKLRVSLVSTSICLAELRKRRGASVRLDHSLMCASGKIERDNCEDDGYPLVCPLARDSSQFQLVGIVYRYIGCGSGDAIPYVYTNVLRQHGWINQQIGLNPYVNGPTDEDSGEIMC